MSPYRPFDPRRVPFYYGWGILAVGMVGMVASFPGQTAGVSVFTDHLTGATGLSRLQLANAYLLGTTTSGLLLPIGGRWIDTYGTRATAFGATLGLAATIAAMSFVGPMGSVTGMIVVSIGFGCMRFCGQGMLTLSSRTMVSQWFDRRRGLVSSVASAGVSFVFASTPLILYQLIEWSDFRWAWRQLALGLVVILGSVVLVFFRSRPEDVGLRIDGQGRLDDGQVVAELAADPGFTRAQAVRDPRFWVVTLPVTALAAVGTALTFHIVDLGREIGIGESSIVRVFIPIAFISVPVSLISGWLADTIPVVLLGVAAAAFQVVMYLTVFELAHPVLRIVAIGSWGAAQGLFSALTSAALPRLFGRTHLGSIAGLQMSSMVIGSAIGPAFFAFVESTAGSYRTALLLALVLPGASLLLAAVGWIRAGSAPSRAAR